MVGLLVVFFAVLLYGDYLLFERGYALYGRLLGEAFAGLILLVAVANMMAHRRFDLPPKYVLWAVLFIFVVASGVVANQVPSGAVVMGIRENFKYVPMFLLPVVYAFQPAQIKTLLLAILFFAALQLPFMVEQRISDPYLTGDRITGTLLNSNHVSVFLICCWSVVFAAYLRQNFGFLVFLGLSGLLLVPTMLNETKGSLVLLPFAFMMPLLLTPGIKRLGMKLALAGVLLVGLAFMYSIVNTVLLEGGEGSSMLLDFYLNPDRLIGYIIPATQGGSWMGRGDKLLLAWQQISDSGVQTLLGVGLGNVNDTSHEIFTGTYSEFGSLLGTTFNQYLWETGVVGVLLALILPLLSLLDARQLSRERTFPGMIAAGWGAVSLIMFVSVFYIRAPDAQAISYIYFFFAGYVARQACLQRHSQFVPFTRSSDKDFPVIVRSRNQLLLHPPMEGSRGLWREKSK